MIMIKKITYLLLLLITVVSCESVIEPDLKDVPARLVIEGEITNYAGPHTVKISKSTSFTESSSFVGVENAFVTITDNLGTIDTLIMGESGIYNTTKTTGTPHQTYTLKVLNESKEYISESTMPSAVLIDTVLFIEESVNGRNVSFLTAFYTDPANETNQYRFKVYENDVAVKGVSITNDDFYAGTLTQNTVKVYPPNQTIPDSLKIELMCIDPAVYDYFFSLSQTISGQAASPANPNSNISGGCLGYFSAHTIDTKKIIINQ